MSQKAASSAASNAALYSSLSAVPFSFSKIFNIRSMDEPLFLVKTATINVYDSAYDSLFTQGLCLMRSPRFSVSGILFSQMYANALPRHPTCQKENSLHTVVHSWLIHQQKSKWASNFLRNSFRLGMVSKWTWIDLEARIASPSKTLLAWSLVIATEIQANIGRGGNGVRGKFS